MKTLVTLATVLLIFVSCSNNNSTAKENTSSNSETASSGTATTTENNNDGSIDDVLAGYLDLKNALTNDNGKNAANAANQIAVTLAKVDESTFTSEQKKVYGQLKDDINEHADHIGSNSSNIAHQREHFELLSNNMVDLVKAMGSSQTLHRDFCPMYNNKKGAYWLSETKEIKNPYYGSEMLKCGEVKEEIKAKG